jgi:hypothetical protein
MSHAHLSELAIARLVLDGAEPPAHTAGCMDCRAAVDQARRDAARFAREVGPRTLPAIEARFARRRAIGLGVAGLAALAAVAMLWIARSSPGAARGPVIAAKGGAMLHVIARHAAGGGDHVFEVEDGAPLVAGDAIRFAFDLDREHDVGPGGVRYALVVSIDGARRLSVYYPYGGAASAPIDPAAPRVVLDGSIVLDDTPGPERIWAVISDRPIPVAELSARLAGVQAGGAAAIRLGAELVIPGARLGSMWFEKPAPSPERTP